MYIPIAKKRRCVHPVPIYTTSSIRAGESATITIIIIVIVVVIKILILIFVILIIIIIIIKTIFYIKFTIYSRDNKSVFIVILIAQFKRPLMTDRSY